MQLYHFDNFKKCSVIFVFKSSPPKHSGVHCDIIIKTVNAHLTNEITDYKIVALEFYLSSFILFHMQANKLQTQIYI